MRTPRNRIAGMARPQPPPAGRFDEPAGLLDLARRRIAEFPRAALAGAVTAGVIAGWWVKR